MTSLRKSIFYIIVLLAIIYNLERLDIVEQNIINIEGYVYPLILCAVLSVLYIPFLWRSSISIPLFIWLGIYLTLRFLLIQDRPIIGGIETYLTITEMAFMSVSILFSAELARRIEEYEDVIAKIALPEAGRKVYQWSEALDEVKGIFAGSRRHNRPLSVLVVEASKGNLKPDLEHVLLDLRKLMLSRFISASLAQLISKEARRTDLIVEKDDKHSFLVICPETSPEGSDSFGKRIQSIALEKLGVTVNFGTASFPEDALTFDDLLQKARFDLVDPARLNYPSYDQATANDDTK